MAITTPKGEQIQFVSAKTGTHSLDTYLEAAEVGNRQLHDLLDDMFDSSTGVFKADNFQFRFDTSTDKLQVRVGQFANSTASWTDVTTFFKITGTFSTSTSYNNFDLVTLSTKDIYIVHGLTSATAYSSESNFISSANTEKLVDVSEAKDWASKTDGQVSSTDYSSKAWAIGGTGVTDTASKGAAKEWATKTSGTVDGSDYSAKHWATTGTVATVSGAINNINTVSASISNVNTTATNISNVNTVAGINANVTTVAGVSANVTTVAANNANVTTVATNNSNINSLATNMTDINTVADEIDNNKLQTVANNINAVITAADDLNEATSEIDTVANNIANVNTVGGISANVTTVAGISANTTTVAGISANVTTVAGIAANVTTVAGMATDVTTAATNTTAFNNLYLGAQSSAPTQDPDGSALDLGDLYFDTSTNTMKVYAASGWTAAGSSVNGTADRFNYTATAGQTTFTGNDANGNSLLYDSGYADIYMNGVKLAPADYTASNGTSVVLASGAALNDTLEIIAYGTFTLSTHYTQTQSDARYVNLSGDTMTGDLALSGADVTFGDNDKAIFGAELEIYSDATHARIREFGSGQLKIQGDNMQLLTSDGASTYVEGVASTGAVTLYHASNAPRLATSATGISVTGKLETSANNNGGVKANYIRITDTDTTATAGNQQGGIEFYTNDVSAGIAASIEVLYAGSGGGGEITFNTNASSSGTLTEALRIDENGNVGIGTSSPANTSGSCVDASGPILARGYLNAHQTSAGVLEHIGDSTNIRSYGANAGSGSIAFNTGGGGGNVDAERMVIDSSGNVGIGTSSPSALMHISGSSSSTDGIHYIADNTRSAGGPAGIVMKSGHGDWKIMNSQTVANALEFIDGGSPDATRMLINSTGKVGIGRSDPATFMDIYTASTVVTGLRIRADNTGTQYFANFEYVGSSIGSIHGSNTSTSYNTSSDYRLKTDAQPMTGASDRVLALNPVNFEWIADGSRVDGFLAHEAQAVVPEAVTGTKDAMRDEEYEVTPAVLDADGNETTPAVMGTRSVPDMQGIDQSKLVPLLTAALREALTKIDTMETRLAALEAV